MLCAEVLCSVSLLVFCLYHFPVMIGYFDRNNVALEKNQLDWRTDRRFGQRGKYDSVILQKIKSSSNKFHFSLQDATLENENIKNGDTLVVEEGRLPPKVIYLETFNKRLLQSYYMCTEEPLLQFDRVFFCDFVFLSRRDFFVFHCGKQKRQNQVLKAFSPGLHRVYKVSRSNFFFFFLPWFETQSLVVL